MASLGPAIGRAVSLAIINIAGRQAGVTDLAIFSSPANFSCCFAEAEELSPFAAYHMAAGFEATDSVVTVIGTEAPHSIILEPSGDVAGDALPATRSTSQIHLIVAGGPGSYSAVLPGWSYAPHRCRPISGVVEVHPS